MRGASDFGQQRRIARRRISHAVTSLRIGCQDLEHRAAGAGARRVLKIRAIPIHLSKALVAITGHTKLTQHQWFLNRESCSHAIVDKLAERFWRVDKTVEVVARV